MLKKRKEKAYFKDFLFFSDKFLPSKEGLSFRSFVRPLPEKKLLSLVLTMALPASKGGTVLWLRGLVKLLQRGQVCLKTY